MAKVVKGKKSKQSEKFHLSLTNKNYMIIGVGVLTIIIGYVFMSENSVDGFLPTVIAPILLVLGYIVIVPFGLLFQDKSGKDTAVETDKNVATGTNNIKTK